MKKPRSMRKLPSLSFLIPTYNNEATIETVIRDAIRVAQRITKYFEVIVINDGSTDQTAHILKNLTRVKQLSVITHDRNRGYGETIKELYYRGKSEWLFSLPGDGQIPASELLVLASLASQNDMIIGWRQKRRDPPERLRQSRVYNRILKMLFGVHVHDANSVRLMKRAVLSGVELSSTSAFVDAELCIKATKRGYRIKEVPIAHRADVHGGSGGQLRTILPTIVDMVRIRLGV